MSKYNSLLPNIESAWKEAVPFQVEDAEFARDRRRLVLGHQTGLGKTFISMLAWSLWPKATKVVMVGSLGSVGTWNHLLNFWAGTKGTFIQGYSDPAWSKAIKANSGIYLTTYSTLLGLMQNTSGKPSFDLLITDELHKCLRNRTSTYKAVARLDTEYYIGLSATWGSRGPQDLWPVLNIVNRSLFSSYWKFVETWCYVENTDWGKEVFGARNAENLKKLLREKYYRSRKWVEVGHQFGTDGSSPVIRRTVELDMTSRQADLYSSLEEDMYAELDGDVVITPTVLAKLTRLLQIAISPTVLFPKGDEGIAFRWLSDKIEEEPHTVVFSVFKETLDQFEAYVHSKLEVPVFRLHGGIDQSELYEIIRQWKEKKGIMLCTIGFAQSFPLDTTNNAYMLGFDWDPNNNIQAEGRLRRLDTIIKVPCNVTYIIVKKTKYEDVKDVVNDKVFTISQVL